MVVVGPKEVEVGDGGSLPPTLSCSGVREGGKGGSGA
jgi:hypothetical protein